MFKNYIKLAVRNILKYKIYSFINIFGLSIGLTCCILIFLYSEDELTYDKFHKNSDNIYALASVDLDADGNTSERANTYTPAVLRERLPEFFGDDIQAVTTLMNRSGTLRTGEKIFNERIKFAESNFFQTLTFPLLYGNADVALINEKNIVLTKEQSFKYFGKINSVGEELQAVFGEIKKTFIVSAIAENPPANSTIQFDFVVNINNQRMFNLAEPHTHRLKSLGDFSSLLIITLKDGTSPETINNQFDRFTLQVFDKELDEFRAFNNIPKDKLPFTFTLEKYKDVHFNNTLYGSTDIESLYILIGIALIILGIACINFMNLSIGRSSIRFKEIGVRKVIGANKTNLLQQFLTESIIITFISLLVGLFITYMFLPTFNTLAEKQFSINDFLSITNISVMVGIALLVGSLVGMYPALLLSRFNVTKIFRGSFKFGSKNVFKKTLIVTQFALSVFLIITTLIRTEQLEFMLNKDLGFEKEGIIVVDLQERKKEESQRIWNLYKNRVAGFSDIEDITATSSAIGGSSARSYVHYSDKKSIAFRFNIDDRFIPALELDLVAGRNFSQKFSSDTSSAIINETLAGILGIESLNGEEVKLFNSVPLKIIGIVKDFDFISLEYASQPAIFYSKPNYSLSSILVKVSSNNIKNTINFLSNAWSETQPDKPFTYTFMNEDIEQFYNTEKRWGSIIAFSSSFAIIIALMGVFGLTTITISRRIKEIGIRKILGAKVSQITSLLLNEVIVLVCVANLIAWPVVYWLMDEWLNRYANKIEMSLWTFVYGGLTTLTVTLITVSFLTIKAAYTNPANSIRNE